MNTYNTVDNSYVDSWLPRARRAAGMLRPDASGTI